MATMLLILTMLVGAPGGFPIDSDQRIDPI